jgi:crossover junction endodeoxyribonuclease RuvC
LLPVNNPPLANERIILGIDPGTTIMGFGLIKVVNKKMEFLQLNELQLSKYDNHYQKLKIIFERTIELIETHNPDEIAIEAPFFGKNVQSMLKLGRAHALGLISTSIVRFYRKRELQSLFRLDYAFQSTQSYVQK